MGTLPQLSVIKGPTRQLTPIPLHKLFQKHCQGESGHKTALIYDGKKLTYAQVDQITNKMAKILVETIREKNLQANSDGDYVIAVNMHPSDQLILVLLAIWKAGGAYLPLDHSFPQPRIEHIIQEAQPVMVIYDEDTKDYAETLHVSYNQVIELCNKQTVTTLDEGERVHHQNDDLAIILYTSGSTGIPKGVRIPHRVILNRLQWQFKTFPYADTEKVCVFKTALTFVDSVSEILGPLINGLTILVVPKIITKDPERLIDLLDTYKVERLVLVPSLLRSMLMYLELKNDSEMLKSLKLWVCSGEVLTVSLAKEFFDYFNSGRKLCNFYGSTEIMGDVTFQILEGKHQVKEMSSIPIGIPVDNTIIYLLDGDLRPVKAGETGELFVSGLNLASGYVNGRDKDKFVNNQLAIDPIFSKLYRTGDFARLFNGVLLYEGRTDSQVKIRGHRVDLSEVERAVSDVGGVEKAVVLCYKPGEMNQALLAFVKSTALMNENQIENILKEKLTAYMVPQVILVESIPLLVNGKIDRQALLKSYENTNNNDGDTSYEIDIDYAGVPANKMEAAKVLFETVASVLNKSARSAISLEANFYEIGGNSLNSIFTISQLKQQGYTISITDFLSAIDLGEVLERMTSSATCIQTKPPTYTSEPLNDAHKDVVLDMITTSFYQKADLEQWLMPDVYISDYAELMDALWPPLMQANLSFIVKNETGKIIGVALNMDARDEPEVEITSKLSIVFEFLEVIESLVRDRLPPGKGKIFHSLMMGTHSCLSGKENVAVMQFMESEVLNLATKKQFAGIFTTNTSPLTQQLATDVYHYQTLLDYQVNKYVASDNSKPFGQAPDSQRAIVQWKPIN